MVAWSPYLANVGVGLVVGVDGIRPPLRSGEVPAPGTEICGCAEGGVVDIERVRRSVPVSVPPHEPPRGGDELHGPDGVIPAGVVVQGTAVRITNGGEAITVEAGAHDGAACLPPGVEAAAAVRSVG